MEILSTSLWYQLLEPPKSWVSSPRSVAQHNRATMRYHIYPYFLYFLVFLQEEMICSFFLRYAIPKVTPKVILGPVKSLDLFQDLAMESNQDVMDFLDFRRLLGIQNMTPALREIRESLNMYACFTILSSTMVIIGITRWFQTFIMFAPIWLTPVKLRSFKQLISGIASPKNPERFLKR